jgi:hypothetical protein
LLVPPPFPSSHQIAASAVSQAESLTCDVSSEEDDTDTPDDQGAEEDEAEEEEPVLELELVLEPERPEPPTGGQQR